jgi:hypothetical protein
MAVAVDSAALQVAEAVAEVIAEAAVVAVGGAAVAEVTAGIGNHLRFC